MSQGVYSLSDSDSQGGDEQDDSDPFYREFKAHKKHYYNEKFNVTVRLFLNSIHRCYF